jgi:hypothetical protein
MNGQVKTTTHTAPVMTLADFAALGTGHVAYMRKVDPHEFARQFGADELNVPVGELWALFAANGQPILLADGRAAAMQGAEENNLATVSIH